MTTAKGLSEALRGALPDPPPPNGRRVREKARLGASEERTAERKRDSIAVAGRLFAERGFHGTSMADIALEFGVRKATLYHWVDSKESLLSQVLADVVGDAADEMAQVLPMDLPAAERLRMLIRIHVDSWASNPHNIQVGITEARWLEGASRDRWNRSRTAIEVAYKQVFREGLASGEFQFKESELTLVVNSVLGMVQWFPRWYDADGWASPEYIANLIADLALRGLIPRSSRFQPSQS